MYRNEPLIEKFMRLRFFIYVVIALMAACSKEPAAAPDDESNCSVISVVTRADAPSSTASGRMTLNLLTTDNLGLFPIWALCTDPSGDVELSDITHNGNKVPDIFISDNYIVDPTNSAAGHFSAGDKEWNQRSMLWYSMATKYAGGYNLGQVYPLYYIVSPEGSDWSQPNYTFQHVTSPNLTKQQDILIACAKSEATRKTGAINFDFHHILSQIEIRAKIEATATHIVKIAAVKLSGVNSTATFKLPNTDGGEGVWSGDSAPQSFTSPNATSPLTLNATAENIHFCDYDFWFVPQVAKSRVVGAADWDEGFTIWVLCRVSDLAGELIYPYPEYSGTALVDVAGEKYAWAGIPLAANTEGIHSTWVAENKYTYTLNFTNGVGYVDPEIEPEPKPVLGDVASFDIVVEEYASKIAVDPFEPTPGNTL